MPTILEVLRNRYETIKNLKNKISEWDKFHPRAMKLIRQRKNFLVVSEDEPYFFSVYTMIRNSQKEKDKWTHEDEGLYIEAMLKDKKKRHA